jgi:hypothetical protein
MGTAILVLLREIGAMLLWLIPGLADTRTQKLLERGICQPLLNLHTFIGLKFVVSMTFLLVSLVVAYRSESVTLFLFLLILPAAVLGWFLPNFFLARSLKKDT